MSVAAAVLSGAGGALLGICGPFTDVSDAAFCPFVLEIFTLGITTGTSPTTYDPASSVSRLQMAAFLSRTVDGALKRGSRRAALDQFWTTQNSSVLGLTTVPAGPFGVVSDGADIWVASRTAASVSRVRASDGKLLETWTGATQAFGILSAMGRVLAGGSVNPGALYAINPAQPAGAVTTVASNLGVIPLELTFDGERVWTANNGSVSIITPGSSIPWSVTTVTAGFGSQAGALFDGSHVWITDVSPPAARALSVPNGFSTLGTLVKLDAAGAILQSVTVGFGPLFPAFDGANIWVPNNGSNSVSVVRAATGAVLQTLTGNGLAGPQAATFNGERVLVTSVGNSLSVWKAADLSPLGFLPTGVSTTPYFACSDGIAFWITLNNASRLARF